jgi:hypothetical protein
MFGKSGGVSDFLGTAYGANGAAAGGLATLFVDVALAPRLALLVANLTALAPDDTITVQFKQADNASGISSVNFGDPVVITVPGADESPVATEVFLAQFVDREIAGITDGNQYIGATITTSVVANVDAHFVLAYQRYGA